MEEKNDKKDENDIIDKNDIKDKNENTHVGPEILRGFNFDIRPSGLFGQKLERKA